MLRIYQRNWTQFVKFEVNKCQYSGEPYVRDVRFDGCESIEDEWDLIIKLKEQFPCICLESDNWAAMKMTAEDLHLSGFEYLPGAIMWEWRCDTRGAASNSTMDRLIQEHYIRAGMLDPEDVEGTSEDIMDWEGI